MTAPKKRLISGITPYPVRTVGVQLLCLAGPMFGRRLGGTRCQLAGRCGDGTIKLALFAQLRERAGSQQVLLGRREIARLGKRTFQ